MRTTLKVGDKARIVNPEIFVRCGYPLGISDGLKLLDSFQAELSEFLYSLGITAAPTPKMEQELAFMLIRAQGFGGNERKIFTQTISQYQNCEVELIQRKVYLTGKRQAGWQTSDGEYNPAYLSDIEAHVMFEVTPISYLQLLNVPTWIESIHLQKV